MSAEGRQRGTTDSVVRDDDWDCCCCGGDGDDDEGGIAGKFAQCAARTSW